MMPNAAAVLESQPVPPQGRVVPAAIEVRNLTKEIAVGFWGRRVRLLHDVSFVVPRGVTAGFVGSNGAGKSTTIRHLIGGCAPTSGSVRIFGSDPRDPVVRRRLGYMPELPPLPGTLTPNELMKLHSKLCGASDPAKSGWLLDRLGLLDRAQQRVGTLSKGQQTRLTLALALLHDPDLLVLDEPMSGLDPAGRILVRTILREEAARGRTILFSSHVLADVEALCDEVIVIEKGRVVYAGATAEAVGPAPSTWTIRVHTTDPSTLPDAKNARREGDTWVVVMEGDDGLSLALRLQSSGARVLSLEPKRASLEERLVTWMGKKA